MSPTKKRQTMGKMTRERELKERRAQKQQKKDLKKQALETPDTNGADGTSLGDVADVGLADD